MPLLGPTTQKVQNIRLRTDIGNFVIFSLEIYYPTVLGTAKTGCIIQHTKEPTDSIMSKCININIHNAVQRSSKETRKGFKR